jgi:hypothetical protein
MHQVKVKQPDETFEHSLTEATNFSQQDKSGKLQSLNITITE